VSVLGERELKLPQGGCDQNNDRIEKFGLAGEYLSSFGSSGTGNGQFGRPTDIAIGANGTSSSLTRTTAGSRNSTKRRIPCEIRLVLFYGGPRFTGLFDIAVLQSGKLLLAGYRGSDLFVARLRADGRPDRSFGKNGSFSVDAGLGKSCCPVAASIAATRGGGSIVATSGSGTVLMAHIRPNGSLDRSFGRRGLVRGNQRSPEVHDVAVQGNGRIVLVGVNVRHGRVNFVAMRFRRDGALDRGFGRHGTETLPLGRGSFGTSAVTIPNGRVVVGGGAQYERNDRFEYSLVLARLR
jgi:uncharacterized delta-60 repeat protein